MNIRCISFSRNLLLFTAVLLYGRTYLSAQSSGFELHANGQATPAAIGLPSYPGAILYKDPNNDAAFDLGYTFGESHFRLQATNFVTTDAPDKVLAFYRKPLSRYGEVLECQNGKPVGSLTTTRSGLTCAGQNGGHIQVNEHSDANDHELRAGTPQNYRIVGIDKAEPRSTRFALIYVEVPKDNAEAKTK